MDGATIQAKVMAGYAKAGTVLGTAYSVYRPTDAAAPLANLVGSTKAAIDSTHGFRFDRPNEYGDSVWYGLIDGAAVQPGDYLSGQGGTFFVAAKQPLLPVMLVECPRTIRISRQQAETSVGVVGYGGLQVENEVPVIGAIDGSSNWPASILINGSGAGSGVNLPGTITTGTWRILLPPSVPTLILAGDFATDDHGRRLSITSAELTDLGWRLNAIEVHA